MSVPYTEPTRKEKVLYILLSVLFVSSLYFAPRMMGEHTLKIFGRTLIYTIIGLSFIGLTLTIAAVFSARLRRYITEGQHETLAGLAFFSILIGPQFLCYFVFGEHWWRSITAFAASGMLFFFLWRVSEQDKRKEQIARKIAQERFKTSWPNPPKQEDAPTPTT